MNIFNKKIVLFTLITALIVPVSVYAKVHFLKIEDGTYSKPAMVRTCVQRGYPLTIDNCDTNEIGKTFCPTDSNYFRKCVCPSKYKYKNNSDCEIANQSPTGDRCKDSYDKCECKESVFKYRPTDSQAPVGLSTVECERPKVQTSRQCTYTSNGATLADGCVCPSNYTQICSYPYAPPFFPNTNVSDVCEGKARACVCDPSKFTKECPDGGKIQNSCKDPSSGKTYYTQCNSDMPQLVIYTVDGVFDEPLKTSCTSTQQTKGLKDVKITFSRQGESDIVGMTDHTGTLSIPIPFEIESGIVGITIEKYRNEKYDGTDQEEVDYIRLADECQVVAGRYLCNGVVYALSPKKFEDAEGQVRIITTWGSMKWVNTSDAYLNIRDLDTHLLRSDGTFLYYGNRYSNPGGLKLDVDDTQCFGPETMTFPSSQIKNSGHTFYYSSIIFGDAPQTSDTLQKSMTTTYVYVDGELKRIFKSEKAANGLLPGQKGTVWNVFKMYKQGNVIRIDSSGPGNHGKIRDIGTGTGSPSLASGSSQSAHGW